MAETENVESDAAATQRKIDAAAAESDGSATPDQLRAAQKRRDAAVAGGVQDRSSLTGRSSKPQHTEEG